jgi:hypothetical protein
MRFRNLISVVFLVGACADATTEDASDGEAEAADAQPVGKADAASFVGLYRAHATALRSGDVPSVELLADGRYVRSRCYHASCSLRVPETDKFDVYTSSAGKTYVRFWTVAITTDPDTGIDSHPVVADVYEVKSTSYGVKLRKSYTTRWLSLYSTSPSLMCSATGGSWAADACTCPGNTPNMWPATIFISGSGCIATPGASEDHCDSSGGMWTDDDATAIGSYCVCGTGRFLDGTGACASI